ncbi:hypothetical protein [Streptomyces sp. NPDC015345]|uniref:hypothetical protein n=1 Tax=Streptomyces sp. NPDC015345 TaxID=3364953 RepID=UPI0036FB0421
MPRVLADVAATAIHKRQKAAAREVGKAMVAWDQWEEHPVQAAGTTTFNVLTLGAGPLGALARGGSVAGKAGLGVKAAGIGAKIGTYADPLSAGLTVGGKAVSKLPTVAGLTSSRGCSPDLPQKPTDNGSLTSLRPAASTKVTSSAKSYRPWEHEKRLCTSPVPTRSSLPTISSGAGCLLTPLLSNIRSQSVPMQTSASQVSPARFTPTR